MTRKTITVRLAAVVLLASIAGGCGGHGAVASAPASGAITVDTGAVTTAAQAPRQQLRVFLNLFWVMGARLSEPARAANAAIRAYDANPSVS